MSRSCNRAIFFSEFAQNLEMCTTELEIQAFLQFTIFFLAYLCTLIRFFGVFLAHFLSQHFQTKSFDCQENHRLEGLWRISYFIVLNGALQSIEIAITYRQRSFPNFFSMQISTHYQLFWAWLLHRCWCSLYGLVW